jgi:uncharacterized repeat protein (TIGR02543 family)
MKTGKIAALLVSLLVLVLPLLVIRTTPAQTNPVYYSVEPVAIPPLTNLNASINGLETPATPSPVGQNFTVSIHLRGATAANVPAGMSGVEVHFYFGNIVTYAVPTEFTDLLGQTGGVLQGPKSKLLYAVSPGFYDALNNPVSAPFTTAVYYKVAAASTGGGWNGADGLVANITFQIMKQPQSSNGEETVSFELANDFTDLSDANAATVSHDNIPGTLTIDATPATGQQRYTLTVNVVGNGTVTQNPLNTTYLSGANVTLTAVPSASWTFQGWSGDLTGTQNPASITVDRNKTVTATFVTGTFGGSIDLFTQKTPFSGKGPNQSSDAFQQQELVVLYALVTFSGDSIANKIVAFQVNGPANSLQNMTVTGTGTTNSSGMAEFSFRMPTAPANGQQTVFGEWYAVATVDVDQVQLSDSLTFEVGWIVSIKSIVTLNDKLVLQTSFARQDTVVFNLTLENIALTPRSATITVDAQDATGNLIIHIELDNLNIPPGESYTQASTQIPETAKLGEANVTASAYTAPPSSGGTPYSPSVYTTFNIVTAVYYTLTVNIVGNGSVTKTPFAPSYLSNTNVTLTAVPSTSWTFQGWSGDVTGVQNPVNITMNGHKTVTATFTQPGQYYTLTVNVVGNGTVTQNPLNTTYLSGSTVALSATPSANWTFQGWSGDVTGVQNPVNITMNGNKTVTATFTQGSLVSYTLTVNVVGNGTVTQNPLNTTYASGAIVTLTAVPNTSWMFVAWSGDVTGVQNPVKVTMDGNKTVTATFALVSVGHDVAITAVSVSSSQVSVGENVLIEVVAANLGSYSETFNVTVYYDFHIIQVIPIVSMSPRSSETLTVEWNTTNVNPGVYTMSVNATIVEGDTNPNNNNFTDGHVTITSTPIQGQLIPYPIILILLLTGVAILGGAATLMLFAVYSIQRRKRKSRRTSHYVIVSHKHI